MEKKVIPKAQAAVEEIKQELRDFECGVPESVRTLFKQKWEWRGMSARAGIQDEHDYIYSNASKLLHATPASITTDRKNLEREETVTYLRYILVKMLQIIDLAQAQPEYSGRATH